MIENCPKYSIFQKYIRDPLLINSRKFDLRVYALLSSLKPLKLYIYREGLTRFCNKEFDLESKEKSAHLTNVSINKNQENSFKEWDFESLKNHFEKEQDISFFQEKIWKQIETIVSKSFELVIPTITSRISFFNQNVIPFELFGFDFMIDQQFKVWLLEINFSPCLQIKSNLQKTIKQKMLGDLITIIQSQSNKEECGFWRQLK